MKNMARHGFLNIVHLATIILSLFAQSTFALNLRTVDTHDGLSSMFVMSLYQDEMGHIWAGTYNGVSILEGNNSNVMPARGRAFYLLKGNVIEGIQGGRKGHLWFHSNFCLVHWDTNRREIQ